MSAYAPDRKAERPKAHLLGFSSILQVDGFAGYPQALIDLYHGRIRRRIIGEY